MLKIINLGIIYLIYSFFTLSVLGNSISSSLEKDMISIISDSLSEKSIYPPDSHKRSKIYNLIVGKHYRELYSTPISVKSTNLYDLHGGLRFVGQLQRLHALFLEDSLKHIYLVRPLGGATTFMESNFFTNTYNKNEFKDTYLDRFIGDAYTITHPYSFLVANKLAEGVGVSAFDSEIYYIPKHSTKDTIADGTGIEDRLVSVYDLKTLNTYSKVIDTSDLLTRMQDSKSILVNQNVYIRERILDLLIGDWNKTPESWQWYEVNRNDSTIYMPLVADRSHSFTRVDGILFKLMLNVLGLTSITNYDSNVHNLKKANGIGIPLDVALVAQSSKDLWYKEAQYIKSLMTDSLIEVALHKLPREIYNTDDTQNIRKHLQIRRNSVEIIAQNFYDILQKTPVIVGTNRNDVFVIEQKGGYITNIKIYDQESNNLLFDKEYNKCTDEIWLYGLDGNDVFKLYGDPKKAIPITIAGGKGLNSYLIRGGKNTIIYDYKTHTSQNDMLGNAKIVKTNVEKAHTYDYRKLTYKTVNFTPWGVYDSDLGFYLGAYLSKTKYGFKRSPYSYKHRVGFSYLDGLMYQGFFPSLDENKGFSIEAIFGIANDFHNFFGYGNQTDRHKSMPIDYNRVSIGKYSIEPSYYWRIKGNSRIAAQSTWELYNIDKPADRFINEVYGKDAPIFDRKMFLDLNLSYEINLVPKCFISSVDIQANSGWVWNLNNLYRSFPYIRSKVRFEFPLTNRLSLATALLGTVLFSNEYEFYQAATVELRGFRDYRFIGKQSFYQRNDLRLDLGQLKNPFTPLQFGVFGGFDHGRVWYPNENSNRWHISYGGGLWITLFKKYTGKFSYFGSDDGTRFYMGVGLGL